MTRTSLRRTEILQWLRQQLDKDLPPEDKDMLTALHGIVESLRGQTITVDSSVP